MKKTIFVIVISLLVNTICTFLLFLFTSQNISIGSVRFGNCGSPGIGVAFPCNGEFVLPFVILLLGTTVGFFLLKKAKVKQIWTLIILLAVLQIALLWPEYIFRGILYKEITTADFNQSTQSDLAKIGFPIVVPTYLPANYKLSEAITYGSNIGTGVINAEITYINGANSISIIEQPLSSITSPSSCLYNTSSLCSLELKTPNGNDVYTYSPRLLGGRTKFGSTSLEITVTDKNFTKYELTKVIDSFHTIENDNFYQNYYIKTQKTSSIY